MSNRKILYDIAVEKKFNDTKEKLAKMISDEDFNRFFSDAPQKLIKYSELVLPFDKSEILALSIASDALDISSRRNTSLLL
jgi:hypothetical protein